MGNSRCKAGEASHIFPISTPVIHPGRFVLFHNSRSTPVAHCLPFVESHAALWKDCEEDWEGCMLGEGYD